MKVQVFPLHLAQNVEIDIQGKNITNIFLNTSLISKTSKTGHCSLGTVGGSGGADVTGELRVAGAEEVAGEGRGRLLREHVRLTEPRVEPKIRKRSEANSRVSNLQRSVSLQAARHSLSEGTSGSRPA